MGFEIKNICTVVPNPYHPNYRDERDGYYYFSVFITPKLQFDGKLKEFYEMLYWPEYAEKIFYLTVDCLDNQEEISNDFKKCPLKSVKLILNNQFEIDLFKDYSYCAKADKIEEKKFEKAHLIKFLKKGKDTWEKLFHSNVPVEAWPLFLKPQNSQNYSSVKDLDSRQHHGLTSTGMINRDERSPFENYDAIHNEEAKKSTIAKVKFEKTKYRQEFHKKISALSRYPHILRALGLIHDFKFSIDKNQLGQDLSSLHFLLKLFVKSDIKTTNKKFPFDEFFKSVQFIRPYTKCEFEDKKRLRAYYIKPADDSNLKTGYGQYVTNGFLNTRLKKILENGKTQTDPNGISIFEVDQDYYEDRTEDFGKLNDPSPADNKEESTKVVGINKKVFTDEEIEILKQKVSNKPRISKGFSIKVHSQPGNLLTSMDEKLKELTDDNIESEESAFMAHHLDCGYRVDVKVVSVDGKGNLENEFKSLCRRQANYIVDRKKNDIEVPLIKIDIPLPDKKLFTALEDEPWLEEVRLVNDDGSKDRFEEIARWNGWSLTCPPLHNNNSAENSEGDDLELREIKPLDLPKLRFGEGYQYQFRIRIVDICGNGVSYDNKDTPPECVFDGYIIPSPDNASVENVCINYERKEGLGAPLFFPTYEIVEDISHKKVKNRDKKIKEQYKGEDNETLVIRSKVLKSGEAIPIDDECVRYITPPYVTMHFAEVSGTLDKLFENVNNSGEVKKFYKILAAEPKHYYEKEEIDGKLVPFLIDKDIDKILVRWEDHNQEFNFNYKDANDLLSLFPLKIKLQKGSDNNFIGQNKNIVTAAFTPGFYRYYTIQSLSRTKMEPSGTKSFTVIHAVQRPVFLNENQKPLFIKINEEELISNLLGEFCFEKKTPLPDSYKANQKYQVSLNENLIKDEISLFPFSTTAEIIITAEYNEFELNPFNKEGWSFISKSHPKEKKESDSTSTTSPSKADKFILRKSWSNLNKEKDDDKFATIIADDIKKDKIINEFDSFKHSFPDTKFRKVNYKLEAVSKFAQFFDIEKHGIDKNDPNPFSIFATLDSNQNEQYDSLNTSKEKEDCFYTIIKNSTKPSKPNITSIVPVFTITNPEDNNGIYKFEHKTFRVYLGSTWYETGLEEKIAVIHERTANTMKYKENSGEPEVTTMRVGDKDIIKDSSYIKNKISIFANDPTDSITNSVTDNPETYINSSYLDSSYSKKDSSMILNSYLFENTVEKPSVVEDQQKVHAFSIFDVHWDKELSQFYCDIELNEKALTAYTYLLKFAVCRYQEHSIISEGKYDYRFSDVVMTDMVSILPERTVEIDKSKKKFCIAGKRGYRYVMEEVKQPDKKTLQKALRENKFYLIAEEKDEEVIDIWNKDFHVWPIEIEHYYTSGNLNKLQPKAALKTLKDCMIEEYEDLQLDNDFSMEEHDIKYNPRNDPRKRLVFFYKIK